MTAATALSHASTSAPARDLWRFRPPTVAALLVTGGFFFRAGSPFEQHPLAFAGFREAFVVVCALAALVHVFGRLKTRSPVTVAEFIVLALVPTAMLTSAVLALIAHGQPIPYGLFEERRMLLFFAIFVIGATLAGSREPFRDLLGAFYWSGSITVALGLFLQTGALGDLALRDVPYLDPRKDRIIVGMNLYAAMAAVGLVLFVLERRMGHALAVVIGLTGLALVGQTRTTALLLFAAVPLSLVFLFVGTQIAAVVAALAIAWLGLEVLPFIADGERTGIGEVDVRLQTVHRIVAAIKENDGFGMGALSLQWYGGFHSVFDRFFYLSDVGLMGDVYRYGILVLPIYATMLALLALGVGAARSRRAHAVVITLATLLAVGSLNLGLLWSVASDWAIFLTFAAAAQMDPTERGAG